jgi:hypothetical protein
MTFDLISFSQQITAIQIKFCSLLINIDKILFLFLLPAINFVVDRNLNNLRHTHHIRVSFEHLISGHHIVLMPLKLAEVALNILWQLVLFVLKLYLL